MKDEFEQFEIDDVRGLATKSIGPPIRPQDVSDMPLFLAAYWIASKGGAEDFNVEDHATWRSAIEALLDKVRFGLKVTGRRSERYLPDPDGIPSEVFYGGLPIVPPYQTQQEFAAKVFDDVARLELWPTIDPRERGSDRLYSGDYRPVWLDLRVSGPDVARLWPFQESALAPQSAATNPRADASGTDLQIFRAKDCLWSGNVPAIKWVDFRRSVENHIKKSGGTAPSESSFKRFKNRWWELVLTHSA
jgi:hypothetical protein